MCACALSSLMYELAKRAFVFAPSVRNDLQPSFSTPREAEQENMD